MTGTAYLSPLGAVHRLPEPSTATWTTSWCSIAGSRCMASRRDALIDGWCEHTVVLEYFEGTGVAQVRLECYPLSRGTVSK